MISVLDIAIYIFPTFRILLVIAATLMHTTRRRGWPLARPVGDCWWILIRLRPRRCARLSARIPLLLWTIGISWISSLRCATLSPADRLPTRVVVLLWRSIRIVWRLHRSAVPRRLLLTGLWQHSAVLLDWWPFLWWLRPAVRRPVVGRM